MPQLQKEAVMALQHITKIRISVPKHGKRVSKSLEDPALPGTHQGFLTLTEGNEAVGVIEGGYVLFPSHGGLGIPLSALESLETAGVDVERTRVRAPEPEKRPKSRPL